MFNEKRHCGVDYDDRAITKNYDTEHQKFRNYKAETERIIGLLALTRHDTVIDMGCGTGGFTIHAAPACKKIIAVDISDGMLACLREKAQDRNITNIETVSAGYLSYVHASGTVDAVVSVTALHHLPDFWKLIALRRIKSMMKDTGRLYLFDVVFSFPAGEYARYFDAWVSEMEEKTTPEMASETATHIADEYSTTEKHMDMLLHEAGFAITQKTSSLRVLLNMYASVVNQQT